MRRLAFADAARRDLQDVLTYIAQDSPARAYAFVDELEGFCAGLCELAERHPMASGFGPDVRMATSRGYNVLYRILPDQVRIERVLHGARDLRRIRLSR